ncbi:hypothetical protein ACS5NO_13490 [Larkinella sp. GY13]|uniref:hypothetical protein n=1 Tax=Larkinella sp. GY13 TaxID=3453720 RepID=UPI003EEE6A4E
MKFIYNRLPIGIGRLLLTVIFYIFISATSSMGQYVLDTTPLARNEVPYINDASPSLPMHNWTSSSVAAIRRHDDILNRYRPTHGSAFFIITDPSLNHYCLLTSAHVLDYTDLPWSLTNELTDLDFNFRTTFNSEASARTNPTQYTIRASRPLSVTVAEAVSQKTSKVGEVNWQDYAIIKVPKEGMIGIPFLQHAVQFLDEIPTSRLNADPYKSLYVIHHANAKPQQISTRSTEQYQNGAWKYPQQFAINRFPGLYPGASGAPLVLPVGNSGVLGTAIGIYNGDVRIPVDQVFQKLNKITPSLINNCLGKLKKEEWEKGKIIVPLTEQARKALVNTSNAMNSMLTTLRTELGSSANRIKSNSPVQPTEVIATVETCLRLDTLLTKDVFAKKSDEIIKSDIEKVAFQSEVLARQLEQMTLTDSYPNFNLPDTRQILLDAINSIGKFAYFNSKPLANDYNFAIKEIIKSLGPIAFQLISSEVSAFTQTLLYYAAEDELGNGRGKRDLAYQTNFMQAPAELDTLHDRVNRAAQLMGQLLYYYKNADRKYVDFYRGLDY